MGRLYVNQTLERQIRQYCEMNEIEDVNAFANRCVMQGLNIIKFGASPMDNVERENKGIKDINKNETKKEKKSQPSREEEVKREVDEVVEKRAEERTENKEEQQVKVRKIRIIKKN